MVQRLAPPDIDVMASAALESVIAADNADEISAGVIVEIAKRPLCLALTPRCSP